jgi:4-hydroxybenzoate polyprenyltransferase
MKQKLSAYARLMRLHRPVGIWLLLWPCWWSLLLAAYAHHLPIPAFPMVLFLIGSVVMRSAGCIINDMADRTIDAQVERTRTRPLASGEISITEASALLVLLCLIGLLISITLGKEIILLSCLWVPLILAYPFMKRITWWPQLFLGITFNAGAIFGWAAITHHVTSPAYILYLGAIFWTLGYDTIYAMQDRKDDALIGVKSSALRVGNNLLPFASVCYGIFALCLYASGTILELPWIFFILISAAVIHLFWQLQQLFIHRQPDYGTLFSGNITTGAIITLACIAGFYI